MKKADFVLVASALCFTGSLLADEKLMGPPRPAREMGQLSYLAGTWTCAGKAFASPFGPEHASEGTAQVRLALGGFWYEIHYDEAKSAVNPMPYHLIQLLGYDPAQNVFVSNCFDAMGASCSQTSSGWKDNVLSFEGTSVFNGQKTSARDTFTKVTMTEMKHAGAMQGPDGKWMPTDEETCRKAAKGGSAPAKK